MYISTLCSVCQRYFLKFFKFFLLFLQYQRFHVLPAYAVFNYPKLFFLCIFPLSHLFQFLVHAFRHHMVIYIYDQIHRNINSNNQNLHQHDHFSFAEIKPSERSAKSQGSTIDIDKIDDLPPKAGDKCRILSRFRIMDLEARINGKDTSCSSN